MTRPAPVAALLFDLGGVLIDIDFELALRHWQARSRLSLPQLRQRFCMDEAYRQHERGEIEQRAYFAHLREVLELEGSDADIARGWNAIFVGVMPGALECVLAARRRLPCFAFSNSNPTHQAAWTSAFPQVVAAFDEVFVSSRLGTRKPERAAFEAVVRDAGITASKTLFLDDTLDNVEGARAAGLQAVHLTAPGDLRRALTAAAVL